MKEKQPLPEGMVVATPEQLANPKDTIVYFNTKAYNVKPAKKGSSYSCGYIKEKS